LKGPRIFDILARELLTVVLVIFLSAEVEAEVEKGLPGLGKR
jgi:hypothetical protein